METLLVLYILKKKKSYFFSNQVSVETRQFPEEFSVEGHFPVNHEFPGMVIRLSWWCVTAGGGDGDDSSQVAEA